MKTIEEKKEFVLSQLAPYFADPSTCGFNHADNTCEYLTSDGRMCVAGKNMIKPEDYWGISIIKIIENNSTQHGVFKPEFVDILTKEEWGYTQRIHDSLARSSFTNVIKNIELLGLFTYEELMERVNLIKSN